MLPSLPPHLLQGILEFLRVGEIVNKVRPLCRASADLWGCDFVVALQLCRSLFFSDGCVVAPAEYVETLGCPSRPLRLSISEIRAVLDRAAETSPCGPQQQQQQQCSSSATTNDKLYGMRRLPLQGKQLDVFALCQLVLDQMKGSPQITGAHQSTEHYWKVVPAPNHVEPRATSRLSPFPTVRYNIAVWWFEASTKFRITHSGRWGVFLRASWGIRPEGHYHSWLCKDTAASTAEGDSEANAGELRLVGDSPNSSWPAELFDLDGKHKWSVVNGLSVRNPLPLCKMCNADTSRSRWSRVDLEHLDGKFVDWCMGAVDVTAEGEVLSQVACPPTGKTTNVVTWPEGVEFKQMSTTPPRLGVPLKEPVFIKATLGSGTIFKSGMIVDFFYLWPVQV